VLVQQNDALLIGILSRGIQILLGNYTFISQSQVISMSQIMYCIVLNIQMGVKLLEIIPQVRVNCILFYHNLQSISVPNAGLRLCGPSSTHHDDNPVFSSGIYNTVVVFMYSKDKTLT